MVEILSETLKAIVLIAFATSVLTGGITMLLALWVAAKLAMDKD